MQFCGDYGPFELSNSCVRATWGAFVPATVVFTLCVFSIPIPRRIQQLLEPLKLQPFLSLHNAEALYVEPVVRDGAVQEEAQGSGLPKLSTTASRWRTIMFALIGASEMLVWGALGLYRLLNDPTDIWEFVCPLLAFVWLYTVICAIYRPAATAPLDLFSLYLVLLAAGILQLGGYIFDHVVGAAPLPPTFTINLLSANITAIAILLAVVVAMPLGIPGNGVDKERIGDSVNPEDYTTLFGWITFSWIYPLIRRGRYYTLNEQDVWISSPTMQSSPIFAKFSEIKRSTLLRRLWAMNSYDIILDFLLTVVTVSLSYGGPFFLKQILAAVDVPNPTSETRGKACVYAFLAFLCTLIKAQAEVLHHWHCRRAALHMRCALMASIYDKALKRKDLSGITNGNNEKTEKATTKLNLAVSNRADSKQANSKNKEDKALKANDPEAGAGVGKIVSMMSGDLNRLSRTITGAYVMYGAPFEIIIAGTFLYQLLGISAFAGLIVLIAIWPWNAYLSQRSIRILKGTVTARDKRMGILNELIGAIKLIKFYAWEECWIGRVLDAREIELTWLIKSRINYIMFYSLWTCVPIFVSILAFFVYVMQGNELTISIAFTSIALFNMLRAPLNVIPAWIVQFLQAGVALKRIAVYLNEDEVSGQVSSLNKTWLESQNDVDGLGLVNATLKWNEVPEITENRTRKDSMRKSIIDSGLNFLSFRSSRSTSSKDCITAVTEVSIDPQPVERAFALRDVNIHIPEGELTVVTGPTASGKTALLMALLGEMTLIEGKIIMTKDLSKVDEHGLMHSISYAAQTPWLRHQSIKDNILFGYPYDEERYKKVIHSCALNPDLEVLEDGDETEIGARGINLSGGQKARVALARAIYVRSKYVLLDDPLSAVDSHTARLLYENLLCGPLLANRTVILVTHHVELVLPGAHYLVRMLDGRIDIQGSIKELRSQGILDDVNQYSMLEAQKEDLIHSETLEVQATDDTGENSKKPRKLIDDEHRETGGVKWPVYNAYLMASSYWIWGFLAFLVVASQLLGVAEKVWIMIWGGAYGVEHVMSSLSPLQAIVTAAGEDHGEGSTTDYYHRLSNITMSAQQNVGFFNKPWPNVVQHPLFYIGIYAIIGLAKAAVNILSIIAQYTAALRASRKLFKELLTTVVRATFRFHDTTPQGRMLNRFGKDIETVDSSLAGSLQSVNASLAGFFAAIITIAIVFPYFLIPAFFIGLAYRELGIGYLRTSRDIRRLEANTRSPILSEFGEILEGIVTVRAFSVEKRFLDHLHSKIDTTMKMWYSFWMLNRWLFLNFDVLGALAVLVTMLLSIATLTNEAGLAGLCITSAMSFTLSVYWACRFWTALELDLNSVERVIEYLDLPQEPPCIVESNRVPAYWPSNTSNGTLISVENLVVKYAPDLPAVLQNVSFAATSGERVGLLGRTGSGKSTLAMSILRFVDPVSGRIMIDGIDISTIGTHDLRSRLTFIPQDANLFSGTLHENLDPFDEYEDSQVMDVLYRVHMISPNTVPAEQSTSRPASSNGVEAAEPAESITATLADGDAKRTITLDTQVSAGGANFSQGQKQLIAMARALLRRSSIIVLDEATSNIDFETDTKIQATIRQEFKDCLLLTVAHRLHTVIDYDRLIVLDNGQIAECDTPWNLIHKEDGIFRNMCLKSGSFSELEAAAKAKHEQLR